MKINNGIVKHEWALENKLQEYWKKTILNSVGAISNYFYTQYSNNNVLDSCAISKHFQGRDGKVSGNIYFDLQIFIFDFVAKSWEAINTVWFPHVISKLLKVLINGKPISFWECCNRHLDNRQCRNRQCRKTKTNTMDN